MRTIGSILFVTYHFPPEVGGIQTRISSYLTSLSRAGVRSTVFVMRPESHPPELDIAPGVAVERLDGGKANLPENIIRLVSTLAGERIDVVHVFTGASTLFGTATLVVGRLFGLRTAMSIFGREDVALPGRLARVLFYISISLATSVSTNSEATASLLPPAARKKTRVLLGGADIRQEPQAGFGGSGDKSVLFVGRLVKRKGVDDLIEAMREVVTQVPGARLTIVGDGPERTALEDQVSGLGLQRAVTFTGTLRGKRLQDEYERCTVFVLPSKDVADDSATEGLGLSLIEASMHGKPLVGTIHGGIPEIVHDGMNGLLVHSGEPEELTRAISRLLASPELAERLGKYARESAAATFSWDAATKRLLDSYSAPGSMRERR